MFHLVAFLLSLWILILLAYYIDGHMQIPLNNISIILKPHYSTFIWKGQRTEVPRIEIYLDFLNAAILVKY